MGGIMDNNNSSNNNRQKRTGGKLRLYNITNGIPTEKFKDGYDAIDWSKKSNANKEAEDKDNSNSNN